MNKGKQAYFTAKSLDKTRRIGAGFNNARSRIGGKKWVVLSVVLDGNFDADLTLKMLITYENRHHQANR